MKRKSLKYWIAIPLLVATLLSCGTLFSANAESPETVADFGFSDPEKNTTVEGSELLELLLGTDVRSAESEYIDQSGLYKFV